MTWNIQYGLGVDGVLDLGRIVSAPLAARVRDVAVDTTTAASDHQPVWLTLADA